MKNRRLSIVTRLDQLTNEVRAILLAYWDPIGICDVPQAQDEYDEYVLPIARMLLKGSSISDLSRYLSMVEADMLSREANSERASQVAERLLSLS